MLTGHISAVLNKIKNKSECIVWVCVNVSCKLSATQHMETIQITRNIIFPLTFQCFSNITVWKPNSTRSDMWTVIPVYDLPRSSAFPNFLQSLQLYYLLHRALKLWVALRALDMRASVHKSEWTVTCLHLPIEMVCIFMNNYRGADKSLVRPDWKNNWKVAIFRLTRRSLLPQRPGWTDNLLIFFLSGLQNLQFGHCSLFPSWSG